MDLKLTNFDIDLTNGDLSLVTGLEAIRQDLEMSLRTFLEETPYDLSVGVPYVQIIMGRGADINSVHFIMTQQILKVDGVTEVKELQVIHDRQARTVSITGRAIALDEEFPIDLVINPSEPST